MPKKSGRGKVLKTRTKKVPGGYIVCDVYEKAGPQGGKTVCSKPRKRK
jgi:hypothetical protein